MADKTIMEQQMTEEETENREVNENAAGCRQTEHPSMEYQERKRLLFLGLPWTFTRYTVTEDQIVVNSGFLNTRENNCYMYKIQDVELQASLGERLFGLGTVVCFTGDTTHPQLRLEHIKHAKEIKDVIFRASEEARRKRRTLTTLDIGTEISDEPADL